MNAGMASTDENHFLRQSPSLNCTVNNTVQLGVSHDNIYTAFDAASNQLVLASCNTLCVGVLGSGDVGVVECGDVSEAQRWFKTP